MAEKVLDLFDKFYSVSGAIPAVPHRQNLFLGMRLQVKMIAHVYMVYVLGCSFNDKQLG